MALFRQACHLGSHALDPRAAGMSYTPNVPSALGRRLPTTGSPSRAPAIGTVGTTVVIAMSRPTGPPNWSDTASRAESTISQRPGARGGSRALGCSNAHWALQVAARADSAAGEQPRRGGFDLLGLSFRTVMAGAEHRVKRVKLTSLRYATLISSTLVLLFLYISYPRHLFPLVGGSLERL